MCVCLQSVVTGTMTGERACRCECVLGDYYSLRDLGVDHQFVLVASCTLDVPNPNSSIQSMELMVDRFDMLHLMLHLSAVIAREMVCHRLRRIPFIGVP